MTKWEYWFAFGPMSCGELNKIGEDGWEMAAVIESIATRGQWMYYFKRPLPPEPTTLGHVVSCSTSYAPDIGISIPKETNEG